MQTSAAIIKVGYSLNIQSANIDQIFQTYTEPDTYTQPSLHTNNSQDIVCRLICSHQGVSFKAQVIKIAFACACTFEVQFHSGAGQAGIRPRFS